MFSFTSQERKVVLFLIITALVGVGVNNLSKKFIAVKTLVSLNQEFGKVNINTADARTLMGLAGVGEKLAQRIIEFREKQGGFKSIEDLKKIKGINGSRYEKIKDSVTAQR